MAAVSGSLILPAWCGLSKAVFQEFKMVPSAGSGTDCIPVEEFSQNPFCSSKCNFSKIIFFGWKQRLCDHVGSPPVCSSVCLLMLT